MTLPKKIYNVKKDCISVEIKDNPENRSKSSSLQRIKTQNSDVSAGKRRLPGRRGILHGKSLIMCKPRMSPIFLNTEQEDMFTLCAKDSMSIYDKLCW